MTAALLAFGFGVLVGWPLGAAVRGLRRQTAKRRALLLRLGIPESNTRRRAPGTHWGRDRHS